MTNYLLALKPRLSEKAYALSSADRTYVFIVPARVNKHSVAQAVADQYAVKVHSVRMAGVRSKVQRTYRRRGQVARFQRQNFRKAYVTLKTGHQLPIFAAVEEAAAESQKTAKQEKK